MVLDTAMTLVSADSHVSESPKIWEERLPRALSERGLGLTARGSGGGHPGGESPLSRIPAMDQDGVAAEILYPSLGMRLLGLEDAELQEAAVRVYNEWLHEYCSARPDRLYGISLLSAYDIDAAIRELERTNDLGMPGAMIWATPHPDLPFSSDHYDPLWAVAQDRGVPISLHILTGFDYTRDANRRDGIEHYRGAVNHKVATVANTVFDLIFSGVLQRFPGLKIVLVEAEIGWLPFYLQQWDYYFQRFRDGTPISIDRLPSEYFNDQMFATLVNDPAGTHHLDSWGADNIMWSTDFPHANSPWPHSREVMQRQLGHLTDETVRKLVYDNVVKLYGLDIA